MSKILKIKDNVDLKELEKYGLKPKYNVDTGHLEKYVYEESINSTDNITEIKVDDRKILPQAEKYFGTGDNKYEYYLKDFINDVLFNLIKSDLVEEVEEDEIVKEENLGIRKIFLK